MKNIIQEVFQYLEELPQIIKDGISFLSFIFLGSYYKMIKQKRKTPGKKITASWFITEFLMSLFVALIALGLLDYFLKLPMFLTFMLCALLGSMSTMVHDKVEEVVGSFFDAIKNNIGKIFNNKTTTK